jgi:hypothetical protein
VVLSVVDVVVVEPVVVVSVVVVVVALIVYGWHAGGPGSCVSAAQIV